MKISKFNNRQIIILQITQVLLFNFRTYVNLVDEADDDSDYGSDYDSSNDDAEDVFERIAKC